MYLEEQRLERDLLHRELSEAGITVTRTETEGIPKLDVLDPAQQAAAAAVKAAHNQPLVSAAVIALRDLLGDTSLEWQRYLEFRKSVIAQRRRRRYEIETDPVLLDLLADATLVDAGGGESTLRVDTVRWNAWIAARDEVKAEVTA